MNDLKMDAQRLERIGEPLLAWFDEHARALPWRVNITPYRVWVSEVMLQQTRVEAVIPYYVRFLNAFPSVKVLASATESEVLKLWEGLGYYRRALNMHAAAKEICERLAGRIPDDYRGLTNLPGIGDYAAGAILSIAFKMAVPAVDGNVLRVASRVMCIEDDIRSTKTKKVVRESLERVISRDRPGDFNQALMELGALICLPRALPLCESCPICGICAANERKLTASIPVKGCGPKRNVEERTIAVIRNGARIALKKRGVNQLLGGLWEPMNMIGSLTLSQIAEACRNWGVMQVLGIKDLGVKKHIFSHVEWHMHGYLVDAATITGEVTGVNWFGKEEIEQSVAVSKAYSKYIFQCF